MATYVAMTSSMKMGKNAKNIRSLAAQNESIKKKKSPGTVQL
jgi:hypothetical protein